nr:hypothetical protein CFP56_43496 [Quercus suber]
MLMRWNACSSVRGIGFNGYTKFPLPLTPLNLSSTTSCGHALTRRWTTRARFGNMEPEYPSQYHPSPATFNPEPIIPPVTTTNQSTLISHSPQTAPTQQDIEHSTLNSSILSLSLNRGFVPPTPANSPRSSFDFPYLPNPNHNTYVIPPRNLNLMPNPPPPYHLIRRFILTIQCTRCGSIEQDRL